VFSLSLLSELEQTSSPKSAVSCASVIRTALSYKSTSAPIRAATSAASGPAKPPPITRILIAPARRQSRSGSSVSRIRVQSSSPSPQRLVESMAGSFQSSTCQNSSAHSRSTAAPPLRQQRLPIPARKRGRTKRSSRCSARLATSSRPEKQCESRRLALFLRNQALEIRSRPPRETHPHQLASVSFTHRSRSYSASSRTKVRISAASSVRSSNRRHASHYKNRGRPIPPMPQPAHHALHAVLLPVP